MKKVTIKCIKSMILRFIDDDVIALSSQLAYSFISAFFPFIILVMTVIGYSSIRSDDVLIGLKNIMPASAIKLIKDTVAEVVDTRKGNWMSISLIFTIWSISSGFSAVIKGLNKAYDEHEHRGFLKLQIISILFTLGLSFVMIMMIFLLVFGQIIGNSIAYRYGLSYQFKIFWNILRYVVIILSTIFIFASLYHYTPSRKLAWHEVVPGSIFATIGLIIVSMGFAYYVNNFANYSVIYGSIGAVMVLLTWLFLVSNIIIMGGELNALLISKCKVVD